MLTDNVVGCQVVSDGAESDKNIKQENCLGNTRKAQGPLYLITRIIYRSSGETDARH
jgi:hypothetical protein